MLPGKVGCVALGLLLAVVGCAESNSESADTTEATLTSSTMTEASSTTATSTTTTTEPSTVPRGLEVEFPFEGLWMNECELGGSGTVTPYGVVSVGDVEFWDDGPDRSRAGWWYWFANVAIVAVDPGVNALDFVATYEDGSTLTETVTVTCDPEAVLEPGFVVSMDQYDQAEGYLMTFIRGDVDDQPDGWSIDQTDDVVVIPVHPDAIFIVEDAQRSYSKHFTVEEFAAVVTFVDEGHCLACPDGDCHPLGKSLPLGPGCIWMSWEEGGIESIAFELLVDSDGSIRQGTQLIYN